MVARQVSADLLESWTSSHDLVNRALCAEARHARRYHVTVSEYELTHFHESIAFNREVHFALRRGGHF